MLHYLLTLWFTKRGYTVDNSRYLAKKFIKRNFG